MSVTPDPNPWAFDLEPGGDFVIAPNGSLRIVTGWDQVRQRILRRLLTNPKLSLPSGIQVPPDYIFHPDYGIGIAQYVDELEQSDLLAQLEFTITQGILVDEGVDTSRQPIIVFSIAPDSSIFCQATIFLLNGRQGQLILQAQQNN